MAHADPGRLSRAVEIQLCRHGQYRRPAGRQRHGSLLPRTLYEEVHLGSPRHRRHSMEERRGERCNGPSGAIADDLPDEPCQRRQEGCMKLATWNVNSLKVRLPQVLQWLATSEVDVLCLQETKLTDDKFPVADIEAAGYQVAFTGQKTYNGVAILSKHPMSEVVKNNPRFEDEQQRIITATI